MKILKRKIKKSITKYSTKMDKDYIFQGIKVSRNWDCIISFEEMVKKARFIFIDSIHHDGKPLLVMPYDSNDFKLDCFIITQDRYGIRISGETKFNNFIGDHITDSSTDVVKFIKEFLVRCGATDLIVN